MNRIVLFAKRPRPGFVKTRLTPPLTQVQAVRLYRAFLADQCSQLTRFSGTAELELSLDGPWEGADADRLPEEVRTSLQGDGDLGARIERRFRAAFNEGMQGALALGVDTPTLPDATVAAALAALANHGAVIGPSEDGGYTAIGISGPHWELFRGIPWGRPEVLETTLRRAAQARISVHRLPLWYDVDDAVGLARLRGDLAESIHAARAPETCRCLAEL